MTLCDLLVDLLGDAVTLILVGDWGGEAGAVNDRGTGTKLDLGDSRLPFADLSGRHTKTNVIMKGTFEEYLFIRNRTCMTIVLHFIE